MYLRECNGLDPNLMSTRELKENYVRVSNTKGIFAESISSGTPFREERLALSPIEGGINLSPHFSRLTESQMRIPSNNKMVKEFHFEYEEDEDSVDL